jgi:hypothetical protein
MKKLLLTLLLPTLFLNAKETDAPSHLMVGAGIFDFLQQQSCPSFQMEYRWEVHCHHIRPLVALFVTTKSSAFLCGGVGYDIFFGHRKQFVFTPSFAPGVYYHGNGKHLGFPINFRSAIELSCVMKNQGRFTIQFNHISNAHMLWKNPGANSLMFLYAIPFPTKKKGS